MRTILVTGAAGFIGSNFVRMLHARRESVKLVAFDKLTYAGNLANLEGLLDDGFNPSHCSFSDTNPIGPTHRKILAINGSVSSTLHGLGSEGVAPWPQAGSAASTIPAPSSHRTRASTM